MQNCAVVHGFKGKLQNYKTFTFKGQIIQTRENLTVVHVFKGNV
jgi:hypothetical protein